MSQRRHAITLSDGTVVFDLIGGDGEDEDEDEDDDDNLNDDGTGGDDDGEDDGDGESDEDSPETLKQKLEDALAEARKYKRRMQGADKDKTRFQQELEKLKGKDPKTQGELQVALDRVTELEAQLADRKAGDQRSLIRDEFLLDGSFDWQDRKVAFQLLDISDVDVDDKGKVDADALKDAIKELAKNHPYLVKTGDGGKKGDEGKKPERPSGTQPGTHRQNKNQVDQKAMAAKYRQLAGRS